MKQKRLSMDSLDTKAYTKEDYNQEPVYYCVSCHSLKIRSLDGETDYCDNCGSTIIAQTDIETWKELTNN